VPVALAAGQVEAHIPKPSVVGVREDAPDIALTVVIFVLPLATFVGDIGAAKCEGDMKRQEV
jgi:hypothetical protein